jgi:hypothetical protein
MNKEGAIDYDYRLIDAFLYAEIQIWTFDGGKDVAGLKAGGSGFRLKVWNYSHDLNFVVAFTVKSFTPSLPRCSRYCGAH